jgi:PadR family transcriptional regulator, regulatory protein PadR
MPRPLGLTSLQILASVRDGARYGLDIVARTGLSSGTVYPTLARLKRAGLLRSRWEDQAVAEREGRPRRRYHELNAQGLKALEEGLRRVQGLAALARHTPQEVG